MQKHYKWSSEVIRHLYVNGSNSSLYSQLILISNGTGSVQIFLTNHTQIIKILFTASLSLHYEPDQSHLWTNRTVWINRFIGKIWLKRMIRSWIWHCYFFHELVIHKIAWKFIAFLILCNCMEKSSTVFHRRNSVIQVKNNMMVSK